MPAWSAGQNDNSASTVVQNSNTKPVSGAPARAHTLDRDGLSGAAGTSPVGVDHRARQPMTSCRAAGVLSGRHESEGHVASHSAGHGAVRPAAASSSSTSSAVIIVSRSTRGCVHARARARARGRGRRRRPRGRFNTYSQYAYMNTARASRTRVSCTSLPCSIAHGVLERRRGRIKPVRCDVASFRLVAQRHVRAPYRL